VTRHGLAFLRGHRDVGVLAVGKHFPGHGDTETDSHIALPVLHKTLAELDALELAPFRAAHEQGLLESLMTAHILFPDLDPLETVTLSHTLLETFTRRIGWSGLMYSDALSMAAILDRYPQNESARRCIEAGCDQALMFAPDLLEQAPFIEAYLEHPPAPTALERAIQKHGEAVRKYPFKKPNKASLERVLSDQSLKDDIAWVARAALRVHGELPKITPQTRVLAVLPHQTSGGAASNSLPLAADLNPILLEHFPNISVLEYERDGTFPDSLERELKSAEVVLFITAQRLTLERELKLSGVLEGHYNVIHLNLWNPEVSAELPFPGVQTFGYHPVSMRAAVEKLLEG